MLKEREREREHGITNTALTSTQGPGGVREATSLLCLQPNPKPSICIATLVFSDTVNYAALFSRTWEQKEGMTHWGIPIPAVESRDRQPPSFLNSLSCGKFRLQQPWNIPWLSGPGLGKRGNGATVLSRVLTTSAIFARDEPVGGRHLWGKTEACHDRRQRRPSFRLSVTYRHLISDDAWKRDVCLFMIYDSCLCPFSWYFMY